MEKAVAGLVGAIGALTLAGPSHAVAAPGATLAAALQAQSYADLLQPIPDAVALRQELAASQDAALAEPTVTPVQYYERGRYHHHHHHWHRRYDHHHHHHHRPSIRVGPVVIR